MKSIIFILLVLLPGICTATDKIVYELKEKTAFENEIDTHYCEKLIVNGTAVSWVTNLVEAGKSIIFRECEYYKEPYKGSTYEGIIPGGLKTGWFELKTDSALVPKQLLLPKLTDFSNPSFCNSYIAYWGEDKSEVRYAMIVNIDTKEVLREYSLGKLILETDNLYHLKPGRWSSDCSSVTFQDERYIKTIKIKI